MNDVNDSCFTIHFIHFNSPGQPGNPVGVARWERHLARRRLDARRDVGHGIAQALQGWSTNQQGLLQRWDLNKAATATKMTFFKKE